MKKILLIVFLLVQIFVFTGCKNDLDSITIGDQYIFQMEEENYYIYFYKDGCSSCELTSPLILENIKNLDKPIYAVNLHPKGESESKIHRKFPLGNTAQGINGDFYVNGAKSWTELYIASTPALIEIVTVERDGEYVKRANFITNGETNITEYIKSLIG